MNNKHFEISSTRGNSKGFTLIEVMIVVAIVAILASIGIPSYRQHMIKSNRAAAESFMLSIANKQEQYVLDARTYATSLTALNLNTPPEISTKYTITLGNIANNTYTITATPKGGQASDTCGAVTLDQAGKKLPASGCW